MNLILFGGFLSAGHYRGMGVVLGDFCHSTKLWFTKLWNGAKIEGSI